MIVSIVAVIVALLGVLLYVLASNSKVQELGRLMFFAGLLVALLVTGGKAVRIP